jgi:predicted MFS family arabinose efflux permease
VGVFAGLGIIFGPLVGSAIAQRLGNRATFLAAIGFGLLNYVVIQHSLKETLPLASRKPMDWKAANPLSFMKLLTSSTTLAKLTVALGLQCVAEPRFLLPYVQLMWAKGYGYSPNKIGFFLAVFGVSYVGGAASASKRMKTLGPAKHITESNLANAAAFGLWSVFNNDVGSVLALVLLTFGIRKRDGLEVLILGESTSAVERCTLLCLHLRLESSPRAL